MVFLSLALWSAFLPFIFAHPQTLEKQAKFDGGYALIAATCPQDTNSCGNSSCCPTGTTCAKLTDNYICCPGPNDCVTKVEKKEKCANSSWSLWDVTGSLGGPRDPICCMEGFKGVNPTQGLMQGNCVADDVQVPEENMAVLLLGSNSPTGTAIAVSEPGARKIAVSDETATVEAAQAEATTVRTILEDENKAPPRSKNPSPAVVAGVIVGFIGGAISISVGAWVLFRLFGKRTGAPKAATKRWYKERAQRKSTFISRPQASSLYSYETSIAGGSKEWLSEGAADVERQSRKGANFL